MQLSVGISLKLKNQISNKVTVNEIQLLSENLFAWFRFMCILAYEAQGYVFPLCCQLFFSLPKNKHLYSSSTVIKMLKVEY